MSKKIAGLLSRKKARKWAGDAEDHPDHLEALAREALLSVEERGGGVKAARRLVAVAALLLEREEDRERFDREWLESREAANPWSADCAASLTGPIASALNASVCVESDALTIPSAPTSSVAAASSLVEALNAGGMRATADGPVVTIHLAETP